ncbi:MAG: carbohydrate kinase [Treponema sp.]|jgi:fructokinase|nr:carbohydrate kinase [Treponema sp.]
MYDVCALGELLIDFTPSGVNEQGINLFGQNPGGSAANMLAMITKLGGRTAFIGKVGDDEFGRFLEKVLKDAGVDSFGLVKDCDCLTTLAIVHLNESGERSFSFYRREGADLMLIWKEVKKEIIDTSRVFHFSSVGLSGQPCRDTIREAVRYAKLKEKIISYDPNYRSFLWPDEAEAKTEIRKFLGSADILKVSEEEMIFLTGETDLEKGAYLLAEKGPAIVFVSLGHKGAYFRCADGTGYIPAFNVNTIDTTGAGDAFLGSIHYRLRNKNLQEIRRISRHELADIVEFANAAGSLTTTEKGAIPALPALDKIEKCLEERKIHRA